MIYVSTEIIIYEIRNSEKINKLKLYEQLFRIISYAYYSDKPYENKIKNYSSYLIFY